MPKVSVCIPVYNRRTLFRATLWSVLRQTFADFELVVSDNASEEDIEAEVAAAADSRVRYVRQKGNIGGAANFRFLQRLPAGEYVLFLCSDDLLLPDCLARAVAALDANPHCGGAIYRAAHYGEEGFRFLSTMPARQFAAAAEYAEDPAVRDFRFASPSLCLYRRATFERLGGWHQKLRAVGDWEMYSRVIRRGGGVVYLHEVLAIMRMHANRQSNTDALHWDFYHDVMLLAAEPEHPWGNAYRAMALVEQLLWDWRLRKPPWPTLRHAAHTKAFPGVLPYVPFELARRLARRLRRIFLRRTPVRPPGVTGLQAGSDADFVERFWRASETVRAGRAAPSE